MTSSALDNAVLAVGELARRGGVTAFSTDGALLRSCLSLNEVRWRGGMREEDESLSVIFGISAPSLSKEEEGRIGSLAAGAYVGFFDAATDGVPLAPISVVERHFGAPPTVAYRTAGREFRDFCVAFWTLRALLKELELHGLGDRVATQIIRRIAQPLEDLFFPVRGPLKIDPDQRAHDQRRILRAFASRLDFDRFMAGNVVLEEERREWSRGRISWMSLVGYGVLLVAAILSGGWFLFQGEWSLVVLGISMSFLVAELESPLLFPGRFLERRSTGKGIRRKVALIGAGAWGGAVWGVWAMGFLWFLGGISGGEVRDVDLGWGFAVGILPMAWLNWRGKTYVGCRMGAGTLLIGELAFAVSAAAVFALRWSLPGAVLVFTLVAVLAYFVHLSLRRRPVSTEDVKFASESH